MNKLNINHTENNKNGIYTLRTGRQENIKILKDKVYHKEFGMHRKYALLINEDVQRL